MQLHYLVILSLMACFADISVLQGTVATYARCDGIFNMHLTANLPRNLPVKKNRKLLKIRQNHGNESVALFWPTLYRLCLIKRSPTFFVASRICVVEF